MPATAGTQEMTAVSSVLQGKCSSDAQAAPVRRGHKLPRKLWDQELCGVNLSKPPFNGSP